MPRIPQNRWQRIQHFFGGLYYLIFKRTMIHCWNSPQDVAEAKHGYGSTQYWDAVAKNYWDDSMPMCMKRHGHIGACEFQDCADVKIEFVPTVNSEQ